MCDILNFSLLPWIIEILAGMYISWQKLKQLKYSPCGHPKFSPSFMIWIHSSITWLKSKNNWKTKIRNLETSSPGMKVLYLPQKCSSTLKLSLLENQCSHIILLLFKYWYFHLWEFLMIVTEFILFYAWNSHKTVEAIPKISKDGKMFLHIPNKVCPPS